MYKGSQRATMTGLPKTDIDYRLPTTVPTSDYQHRHRSAVLDRLGNAVHPTLLLGYETNAKTEAGPTLLGRRSSASRLHLNRYSPSTQVIDSSSFLINHHRHDNSTYYEQQTLRLDRQRNRDHRRSTDPNLWFGTSSGAHNGNRHVSITMNLL
jgi:hypothetical protein